MMELALQTVAGLSGLVVFVCFVITVIRMFQNNQALLGVLSIFVCFFGILISLIVGWKNKNAWKLDKVMPVYTLGYLIWLASFGGLSYYLYTRPMNDTSGPNSEFGDVPDMPEITTESSTPSP